MTADILSEALKLVRLSGVLLFRVDTGGSWCVATGPTPQALAPVLAAGTTHVIAYHVVTEGVCCLRCGGHWHELRTGDAIVMPHGHPHVIGDMPGHRPVPIAALLGDRPLWTLRHVAMGARDERPVSLLCGFLGCDRRAFSPLFATLPDAFRVPLAAHAGDLLHYAATAVLDERPGAGTLRLRMSEMLFMEALRAYVETLPDEATGWLAGVRDPMVGMALRVMHAEPARAWSVEELARHAASSRSLFAERFRSVVGTPPMHYLTQLRMHLAAAYLGERDCSVARVAEEVGYDSCAAFQRAFKRHFGTPPAAWRRSHGTSLPVE